MFFLGEEAEVDSGGLEDDGDGAVFENDKMIFNGMDVEMALGGCLDGFIGHALSIPKQDQA